MKTGNYDYENVATIDAPKLSKSQRKKLRQRNRNDVVVAENDATGSPASQAGNEQQSTADEVAKLLFHVDIYAIAGHPDDPLLSFEILTILPYFYDIPWLRDLAVKKFEPLTESASFCVEFSRDHPAHLRNNTTKRSWPTRRRCCPCRLRNGQSSTSSKRVQSEQRLL